MPYSANADLPPDVRKRFSDRCQTVWREAWNDTNKRTGSEGRAFATAETAGQNCKKATASRTDTMPRLAIKTLDNGISEISGYLAPFDGPAELGFKDLHGQRFVKSTNFALDWFGDWQRPLLYDHGLDGALKTDVVGRMALETRDKGVWMRAQLEKANEYHAEIEELVKSGKMGLSSGSLAHLVRVNMKSGEILQWPIIEGSLVPEPANPDAIAAYGVKRADADAHVLAVVKSLDALPAENALKWSDAAYDASSGAQILTMLYPLLGREQEEADNGEGGTSDEQLQLLTSAVDAIEQWIALESDEIGTPEEQAAELETSIMSYAIRGWRRRSAPTKAGARNSAADSTRIQAIHDHATALGASHEPDAAASDAAATTDKGATSSGKSASSPVPTGPVLGVRPGNGAERTDALKSFRESLGETARSAAREYLNVNGDK